MSVTTKKGLPGDILKFLDEQVAQQKKNLADADVDRLKVLHRMKDYAQQIAVDLEVKKMLAKRGEEEITGEIKLVLLRLKDLYLERRGAVIEDDPEGDWAWCASCGMEEVDCTKGSCICLDCQTQPLP